MIGIGTVSWDGFRDIAGMLLDLQGGPLAVILQGTAEKAKKERDLEEVEPQREKVSILSPTFLRDIGMEQC